MIIWKNRAVQWNWLGLFFYKGSKFKIAHFGFVKANGFWSTNVGLFGWHLSLHYNF